jgi:hypothetical protein
MKMNNRTGIERMENVTIINARIFSTSSDTIFFAYIKPITYPFSTIVFIYFALHPSPNQLFKNQKLCASSQGNI